ncbi:hypothetical protein [Salinisphaera sp. T31B1]|uniref:hypothetical protein n=1 Tax=Salinisphaera sp. T31B1 TaxID=727963 RepID=UPI00334024CF
MPTPRKPTHLKVIQGTAKKNPGRLNPNEPGFNGEIGEPPAHLDEYTATIWHELVRIACPGVLQKSDRIAVERLACLLALSRRDPEAFTAAHESALRGYFRSLGLTPADRSRVSVPNDQSRNPFEGL